MLNLNQPAYSRLTDGQTAQMHKACLEILERTGVQLYEQEAVDLLRNAGCTVEDGNLVRIPSRLVEQAIASAPKEITLYDRNQQPAMPIAGYVSFFGPGSDCLNIIDHRTNERRKPVLADVVDGITICDALENIDFVMSLVLPSDVNQELADRYQMEVMLTRTTKPIVFVTYEMDGCVDAVEMAEAAAGGAAALREKPFIACYINVTTGLRHNQDALQKLLYLAEKGLPSFYIPGAQAGTAGPVTLAGSTIMRYAGALAGLVIAQLKNEGAPVFMPGWGALPLDMRTTVQSYTGPDHQGVLQSLNHYHGLPMFANGGSTDSKIVDQQAALEACLTMFHNAIVGSHVVHDVGYLESGMTYSLAQLVICNEALTWIKRSLCPIVVNEETLAVDLIDEQGPDGQYIDSDHTFEHFREHWYPELLSRSDYPNWAAASQTLVEQAAAKVDAILAEHQPSGLPEDVAAAIRGIVQRAENKSR
jgi:trimethylamine--corrinoid protein Co-methyltransferase